MKILWVADYSVKEHKGGAQQTNKIMIQEGRKRGHSIRLTTGGSLPDSTERYDLIILNNLTKYTKDQIEPLVASGRCVRYEHDYWVAENYPELYKGVELNIFLSPLHKETVEKKVSYKIDNYELVPSPIPKIFKPKGDKEPNSIIYTGQLCEKKGTDEFANFIADNPEHTFYILGWGADTEKIEKLDNVEFVGQVDNKEVIPYLQKAEAFYHRPKWKEPFGRAVMEAYLCGCNLICNDNIGALSWDWDFSDYEGIEKKLQSQTKFWKIIENVL